MGTRNLTAVQKGGEYKIAQYGQWDGYPEGQGATALTFLKGDGNIGRLEKALEKVRFLEPEGRDKAFVESYEASTPQWSNDPDKRTAEQEAWFATFMSRDIGAEILERVVSFAGVGEHPALVDGEIVLKDSIDFANDSLFCEWAYVVDLDKRTFEVYEGFNREPVTEGRFTSDDPALREEHAEREKAGRDLYHPVVLKKLYPLVALPEVEDFVKECDPPEEEE